MIVREPEWEKKNWGRVNHAFYNDSVGVSCLEVKAGHCCSIHRHLFRDNLFTVQKGIIVVDIIDYESIEWDKDTFSLLPLMILSRHVLRPGDTLQVPIEVVHRFNVLEDGYVTELYTPHLACDRVLMEDIDRYNEGGDVDLNCLKKELKKQGLL